MKFSALFFATLASTSTAFVVQPTSRMALQLAAAEPNAIATALEVSKKFGATSSEARLAWAEVEEMDSRDNSAAMGASLDDECDIDGPISDACMDYGSKLKVVQSMTGAMPSRQATMEVPAVPLAKSSKTSARVAAAPSPALDQAVRVAQQAQAEHGAKSREAVVAWSEVEDVAAAGLANALGGKLNDEECDITEEAAMEACEALESLNQAIREQVN